jgi:hypothetical protein
MVSTLGANYVAKDLNLTTSVWGGDLMVGNPRDLSHLRVRELWVQVVVSPIIIQMCHTPCQIRVQVGRDNHRTCESLFFFFFFLAKKKDLKSKDDLERENVIRKAHGLYPQGKGPKTETCTTSKDTPLDFTHKGIIDTMSPSSTTIKIMTEMEG